MLDSVLQNRTRLTLLVAAIFALNLVVTNTQAKYGLGSSKQYQITYAVHQFERNFSFESHDATNLLAVYGYSISYFLLFPLLCVGVAVALVRRRELGPYRVLVLAGAIDYVVSLPFFLFFPVLERWAYPDSGALLLSDRWSSKLIEATRPISGLNDCFPSFHVSMTVILILLCYLFHIRLRTVVLFLGMTVMFATFVLGIHWLADILAGLAAGLLSVALALRQTHAWTWQPKEWRVST
jgi:membrane-associated phospholipid phosphatase